MSAKYRKVWLTHIVELDPMDLKAKFVSTSGRVLKNTVKNFINSNFFDGVNTIGWLASEGKILKQRHEYKTWKGRPKGTLIVYKDGTVECGAMMDKEIAAKMDSIRFICQGFNLFPLNIEDEGFDPKQVAYSTMRLAIGYRKKDNKIVIAARPSSDAKRAVMTMKNLRCDYAICLDSGGSVNLVVNGKAYVTTTRRLTNIIYW